MKCISVRQPWATLLVIGAKGVETRSWAIDHEGPLAIHAAKLWTRELNDLCGREPFRSALEAAGFAPETWQRRGDTAANWGLPLGKIVGVCNLRKVEPVDLVRATLSARELAFGNYASGRFAWMTDDPRPLDIPMPWRGRLGPFDVPDDVVTSCAPDGHTEIGGSCGH